MPRITGRYERSNVGGEEVKTFIPEPLSHDLPLVVEGALADQVGRAETALGRLELVGAMVPSVNWFLHSFVRKEAVISSQIEGTQATLMDLLAFEGAGKIESAETAELQEVCNHLEAVTNARKQLQIPKGQPLLVCLLNETHRRL